MIRINIKPADLVVGQVSELTVNLTNIGRGKCTNVVCKLTLPVQLVLLQGPDRIEMPYLEVNESATFVIRIRPKSVGTWIITSSNFSYRDSQGQSQRIFDFRMAITVAPMEPQKVIPEPELSVRIHTTDLPLGEWEMLDGQVINTGSTSLKHLAIKVSGLGICASEPAWKSLGPLPSKEGVAFHISVRASESGGKVPIYIELNYTDVAGRVGQLKDEAKLRIGKSPVNIATSETKVRVLFLSADPIDAPPLRLGQELRDIKERLQLAERRELFDLQAEMCVRPVDITHALLRVKPQIVHFSGHGTSSGALRFEDHNSKTHIIQPDVLAALFKLFCNQVICVVLNACYSEIQARAIAKHIDYVIGMSQEIDDQAGIAFAVGFYQALGAGRTIDEAYSFGCIQIRLEGIPQHLIPTLVKKEQAYL